LANRKPWPGLKIERPPDRRRSEPLLTLRRFGSFCGQRPGRTICGEVDAADDTAVWAGGRAVVPLLVGASCGERGPGQVGRRKR
jgi:hypothetical protein